MVDAGRPARIGEGAGGLPALPLVVVAEDQVALHKENFFPVVMHERHRGERSRLELEEARAAAALCASHGEDIAKLALQFSCAHGDIATTIAGSANPDNIRKWSRWLSEPIDTGLMEEVRALFAPVHNLGHVEGLIENN